MTTKSPHFLPEPKITSRPRAFNGSRGSLPGCKKSSGPKPSRRCPGPRAMATGRKMATILRQAAPAGDRQKNAISPQKNGNRRSRRSRAAKESEAGLFRRDSRLSQHRDKERDEEKTVRIVGIDEARSERNEVSWISPVAKALLKAAEGDIVEVRTPRGVERIEILKITY